MPRGALRFKKTHGISRQALISIGTSLILSWASAVSAMPPPAPGNQRGLPPHARELLKSDPSLFYPSKGFKSVIERQKARRAELTRDLVRQGLSPQSAYSQSLVRVTTTRYCPVLCGIYLDKGTPDWPVQDLVDELFSLNYGATNPLGQPGSMREHYLDMSYGTFDLQGGVYGWFAVPQSASYYYSDDNGLGTDRAQGEAGEFIEHTLQAADPTIDFRIYDNDGPDNVPDSGDDDGYADLVMFVHPNEGGECGGDDIWSHSFSYSGWAQHGGPFITNDIGHNGQPIKVDDYTIMPAISCFGGRIEIGVFSHEFGHALGLPDLYDRTAYDPPGLVSTGGMGLFCLMAAGSYGGDYSHPATPTQMCAWSKEELGFLKPEEVVCDTTRALYCLDDAPEAVKLWAGGDYSQNEWFLVENRQRKKWDKYLLGTGYLITHIDNKVLTQNDESCPGGNPCLNGHYQVMVVEADNQWEMETAAPPLIGPWFGEAEDFFSAENNANWDDLTLPSSRNHSGGLTGIKVHNIGLSGEKMFASFSVSQTCDTHPALAVSSFRVSGGCDLDGFLDAGENVSLNVRVKNFPTAAEASGVQGTLTSLSPNVSVVNGTASFPDLDRGKLGDSVVPFTVHAGPSVTCASTAAFRIDLTANGGYSTSDTIVVPVGVDSLFVPLAQYLTDVENASEDGWSHYAYINADDWSHNTNANHTMAAIPGHSWFAAAPGTAKDVSLEPPAFIPSGLSSISFWHKYDTEDNWDGCVLELSTDGGHTWIDVGDLTSVGYNDAVMVNPQSSISGRRCWNGLNASYPVFDQVTLSLSQWAGQTCRIRFRMATDLASTGVAVPGWNIDDILITGAQILRQQCEATPLCSGQETAAPVFVGLESARNPMTPGCDAVDLKWSAAQDASAPITYLIYASQQNPVPTTTPVGSTTGLKFRVSGLSPAETYHFLVRARDSQGNVDSNTAEKSVTLDCEAPELDVVATRMEEVVGCDGDGLPDAGETLDLHVTVRNLGGTHAQGVQATLRPASDRLFVVAGAGSYGDLEAKHFEERVFRIRVGTTTTCQTPATLALDLTAAGGYAVTRTINVLLETDVDFVPQQFMNDVEGGIAGFTHYAESGSDDWSIVTSDAASPTHSWFANDQGATTNVSLQTPPLFVSSSSVLTFKHKYILENGFDGAVLEISTDDGGTWTDIGPNYNSSQNPLGPAFGSPFAPGKAFWSGNSGGFIQSSVNLGTMTSPLGEPLYAGKTVLIRWRLGCDNENSSAPFVGWWIDDIRLTDSGTFTTVCDGTASCEPVGVPGETLKHVTALYPSRPNPMRASTQISYQIADDEAGPISLRIFDVSGRVVHVLVNDVRQAGTYEEAWNGKNATGNDLPGGLYFYELATSRSRHVEKLVILR